ncbi:hypothetical protein ECEC4402_1725, partial [Escherichia coli EC4402]|jgi:hypothetical protein
MSNT